MASSTRQSKPPVLSSVPKQPGELPSNRSILLLLGLIVAAFFVFSYLERINELAAVRAEILSLQSDLAQAEQRNAELEATRLEVAGSAYVGETARAELGLIQPGDDPFVILGQPSAAAATQSRADVEAVLADPQPAGGNIFSAGWWRSLFGLQ